MEEQAKVKILAILLGASMAFAAVTFAVSQYLMSGLSAKIDFQQTSLSIISGAMRMVLNGTTVQQDITWESAGMTTYVLYNGTKEYSDITLMRFTNGTHVAYRYMLIYNGKFLISEMYLAP